MIKSILKYAGKYKILTVVATVMVVIAVAAQILPYIFAYQIISPLIAGESIPWQYAVGRVVGVAVCLVLNFVFYIGGLSLSHIAAFNTLYNLRVSLQGKMEKLPLGVVQEKGTGNLKKLLSFHRHGAFGGQPFSKSWAAETKRKLQNKNLSRAVSYLHN